MSDERHERPGWIGTALVALYEKPAILLIILGAIFLALGISGGVTYRDGAIGFREGAPQWLAICAGALLLVIGIGILLWRLLAPSDDPEENKYGINITYPRESDRVQRATISGTIRRSLPKDHELWILRFYPDERFVPLRKVRIEPGARRWQTQQSEILGASGSAVGIGAYLVGEPGQALFAYFLEAAGRNNRFVEKYWSEKAPEKRHEWYLPAIPGDVIKKFGLIRCDGVTFHQPS